MLHDKNGEPVFGKYGLVILAGLLAYIAFEAFIAERRVAELRRATAIPVASDPLCIKQPDDEAVAACHRWWTNRRGCDPLNILPEGCAATGTAKPGRGG